MNDLSFSSFSPTLYLFAFVSYLSKGTFMESLSMQKEPPTPTPNSALVHIKSKWKKEWPQWGKWEGGGGGLMEGDDR